MSTVSRRNAPHYVWGDGCDGWHLARSDKLSVIQETIPPGCGEVAHSHERAEQVFFVLSGVATLVSRDVVHTLHPEDSFHVPAGVPHEMRNDTDEPIQFLVISTPPSHGDRIIKDLT
ncbi:MAG: cupin domain-containing protein [Pseudomonadota bacterium]